MRLVPWSESSGALQGTGSEVIDSAAAPVCSDLSDECNSDGPMVQDTASPCSSMGIFN